jgi:glucuronate isomerase
MSSQISDSIYQALSDIRLIDPHTHINPHDPASHTLADLLGYHYYTELAHSAGMPKAQIEDRSIGPKELVSRLVTWLPTIENTAQYRWLVELCRNFYGFDSDRIDASNWEELYDLAEDRMKAADWADVVLGQSNVEAVFLTNDFDDELAGFDTDIYVPCLRTDELVFHLSKKAVQQRLEKATGVDLDGSLSSLREALVRRFEHFVSRGARACAISLPPGFTPSQVSDGRATTALDAAITRNEQADPAHRDALSRRVFWTLAELCDEFGLPFDLMIGVNRGVYAGGVYQGQDLYDSRVSLIQYRDLFNAFPGVKFPISVLASVTNQELVSYAWIFPNVVTNGHWWYSNTPSFIARDAAVRLEAIPQTKQIAYYSDAYKLEFVWPKFDMYRRTLANLLASNFVQANGWSESRAVELGRQILRTNVDEIFPRPDTSKIRPAAEYTESDVLDSFDEPVTKLSSVSKTAVAAGAVGAVALAAHEFFGGEPSPARDIDEVELVEADSADHDYFNDSMSTLFDEKETFSDAATVIEELELDDSKASESVEREPDNSDFDDVEENEYATLMLEPGSKLDNELNSEIVKSESETETVDDFESFVVDSPEDSADLFETMVSDDLPSRVDSDDDLLVETPDVELEDTVDLNKPVLGVASAGVAVIAAATSLDEPDQESLKAESVTSSDDLDSEVGTFGYETIVEDVEEGVDVADTEWPIIEDTIWPVDAPDDVPEPIVLHDTLELDVVPNEDEVKSLPLDDVVLSDYAAELRSLDAEKIEAELDSEPLNVGDLFGDESESTEPEIRMLRGESSFTPDEETLQMTSDPSTGELVFPVESNRSTASNDDEQPGATSFDDVDEWDIDDDQLDEAIGSSEENDSPKALSSDPMDDDDWFADLSNLMDDEKPKSDSADDSKD